MPIIAKESSFQLCPEGPQRIVCVDAFGYRKEDEERDRCILAFESEKLMKDGRPYVVHFRGSLSFFKSEKTGQRSWLRQLVEQWRGQPYKPGELVDGNFDIETLIGQCGYATIVHAEGFANIDPMIPLPPGMPALKPSGTWKRPESWGKSTSKPTDDPRPTQEEKAQGDARLPF